MATWAAQLQSIQQLGAQLSRLTTEQEIGDAISNELETLIAFHNVRVYRLREGGWLVPVAMRGLVGEFKDETRTCSALGSARESPAGSPCTSCPRTWGTQRMTRAP